MDGFQIAVTVALSIGTGVVSWCANRIVALIERVAKLEARCKCEKNGNG